MELITQTNTRVTHNTRGRFSCVVDNTTTPPPVFHTIVHREITIKNNDIMGDDNYDTESFKLFDDDTVSLFNGNISTVKNDSGGNFFDSFGNSENILLSTDDNQTM